MPDWLKAESADLTGGRGALGEDTASYLRAFFQFRCEVLQPRAGRRETLPLPASPYQIRPLLGQLDTHPDAAVEMWKAAVADAKGKVPTFDQVNRAALAYKANEANEARRLTAAQQAAQQKAVAAKLKAGIGRDVALTVNVDPSILGGLMVRVGSRLIDSSLKTRLDMLGQALKA